MVSYCHLDCNSFIIRYFSYRNLSPFRTHHQVIPYHILIGIIRFLYRIYFVSKSLSVSHRIYFVPKSESSVSNHFSIVFNLLLDLNQQVIQIVICSGLDLVVPESLSVCFGSTSNRNHYQDSIGINHQVIVGSEYSGSKSPSSSSSGLSLSFRVIPVSWGECSIHYLSRVRARR